MNTQRYSKQWDKALQTIYTTINNMAKIQSLRLPSIKVLASTAGVSAATMWKVVNALCKEGTLISIPRGGIVIARIPESYYCKINEEVEPVPRWQQVMKALQKDIDEMRNKKETIIPTQKQLSAIYKTSPASIRKVLATLVNQGVLLPSARGFKIHTDTISDSAALIIVIDCTNNREDAHHMTPRSNELWRHIDIQSTSRKIRIQLVHFESALEALKKGQGRLYEELMINKSTFGCLVLTLGIHEEGARSLFKGLSRSGKQIALIDELGQPYIEESSRFQNMRLFLLGGGTMSGKLIGEHLARMGHTNVAWITPASGNNDFWVTDRLAGLKNGLASGGRTCNVEAFTLGKYTNICDIDIQMQSDPVMKEMFDMVNRITTMIQPVCEGPDDLFARRTANNYLWFRFVRREMESLFESVVQSKYITAWVLSNDHIAIMALDFLQRHRVSVPKKIALAGFDDGEFAQTRNLTSLNFNIPLVIQAVFDFIMKSRNQTHVGSIVEIPGYVSVRASTMYLAPKS